MDEGSKFTGDYILSVDIDTSLIKCYLYDRRANVKGKSQIPIKLLHPADGASEIDPEDLWALFRTSVKDALADAKCYPSQVRALGICTQRGTFITWDKDTGQNFHNFITWQDVRASQLCKDWNSSWTINGLHVVSKIMHTVFHMKRYLAGSIYKLKSHMAAARLLWAIEEYPLLKSGIADNKVYFGCIGTWLCWKATGKVAAEISLASSTGMFDPFLNEWGYNILKLVNIPTHVLPPVHETSHLFGYCDEKLFGYRIPIAAMAGDQQAGMFGCCAFEKGSVKLTMGTGLFVDMNTGQTPHTSIHGIYPLVGWKTSRELVYLALAECSANDGGTAVSWAQSIGLFDDVNKLAEIATSVENSCVGGVSKNDFICQSIADLLNVRLRRIENEELSALGVAFFAGLNTGFWREARELKKLVKIGQTFTPSSAEQRRITSVEYENWLRAVDRSLDWYK